MINIYQTLLYKQSEHYHLFLDPLVMDVTGGQIIDIMTFNSYSLQYYSFRKGKIGFARTVPVSWTTLIHTRRYNITI